MDTYSLVNELLKNYQSNKSMIEGAKKLNQEESNTSLKKNISVLAQQMKSLDCSIELLTSSEKEMVVKVLKNGYPMSKYARDKYISRTQAYRFKDKILLKLAKIYKDFV